ncbi:Gfo/Idh/MocA family protein [uncultured Clostridium sp.]|uniref:Gfo/Idh/MocA family protein n=1 Tax=uncultured Clostridium sp. TaxID=59620 RepID=UPI0025DE0A15|nr:Gfo/Idh/MocA family oxidoreductase [uncultured Clostridium sp.]
MRKAGELNLAFIGVSHWHVPLYLEGVEREKLHVCAVSDPDGNRAQTIGRRLGCRVYVDYGELLDRERPDFVFAFAPHYRMPSLALELIRRKIPFAIEKPLGLSAEDVAQVLEEAEKNSVFCAIPFVWRHSPFIRGFREKVKAEDILHLSFRFIAGPPSRYEENSPWMLRKELAGGGCMTNLGVHFIDMALYLTGSDTGEVLGSGCHYDPKYDVEIYASSLCRLSSGATLALETGYAFPMDAEKRDNRWNIVTKNGYYTLGDGCFEERVYGEKTERTVMSTDSDVYYGTFVINSLKEYLAGEQPAAGLKQMYNTRKLLDAMNLAGCSGED